MTASLKFKTEDRTILYYNKFKYKVSVQTLRVQERVQESIQLGNLISLPEIYTASRTDREKISIFLDLYRENNKFRLEGDRITFFSNDLALIEQFQSLANSALITEAVVTHGVKLFKNTPPAKFRSYLKTTRIESEFRSEFVKYLERTDGLRPNNPFLRCLYPQSSWGYKYIWIYDHYFIDYDDPSMLTYMHLMFPNVLGKTYKLEKKSS
jgi:hypothetical protein